MAAPLQPRACPEASVRVRRGKTRAWLARLGRRSRTPGGGQRSYRAPVSAPRVWSYLWGCGRPRRPNASMFAGVSLSNSQGPRLWIQAGLLLPGPRRTCSAWPLPGRVPLASLRLSRLGLARRSARTCGRVEFMSRQDERLQGAHAGVAGMNVRGDGAPSLRAAHRPAMGLGDRGRLWRARGPRELRLESSAEGSHIAPGLRRLGHQGSPRCTARSDALPLQMHVAPARCRSTLQMRVLLCRGFRGPGQAAARLTAARVASVRGHLSASKKRVGWVVDRIGRQRCGKTTRQRLGAREKEREGGVGRARGKEGERRARERGMESQGEPGRGRARRAARAIGVGERGEGDSGEGGLRRGGDSEEAK